jgi:RecA-family ATPase
MGAPDKSAQPLISAAPYVWREPAEIGRRPRLYGKHYVRGFVSTTIGRPGLGKSALSIVEMLSMASGRPLLGHAPEKPLGVWYIGEDPLDEIERRIVAACEHHHLSKADLDGRLYINSALEMAPLKLAEQQRGGSIINRQALEQLEAEITHRHIDALILDPLIKFHGMPEGDNSGMELVMRSLSELASKTNIAIETPHHIRKQPPGVTGPATVDDGRGASAIIGAVRSARVLNPMSAADADKAGIAEGDRWRYIRLDQAKANMAPPEAAAWPAARLRNPALR